MVVRLSPGASHNSGVVMVTASYTVSRRRYIAIKTPAHPQSLGFAQERHLRNLQNPRFVGFVGDALRALEKVWGSLSLAEAAAATVRASRGLQCGGCLRICQNQGTALGR